MEKPERRVRRDAVRPKPIASRPLAPSSQETAVGFEPFSLTRFLDDGIVDLARVAEAFHMSKVQLADTAGLGVASVSKASRRMAPKAQTRVTEMLEIISRVRDWAGGEAQAMAWYRAQPIPALDGRTAEALVKAGRASAVRDYLDHVALGGFA
jgi:uncharacterized protein (DUF2384 family)